MSRIRLLCKENETPDGHNKICEPCFDNAGNMLEQDAPLFNAAPQLLSACVNVLASLRIIREHNGGTEPSNPEIMLQHAIHDAR